MYKTTLMTLATKFLKVKRETLLLKQTCTHWTVYKEKIENLNCLHKHVHIDGNHLFLT